MLDDSQVLADYCRRNLQLNDDATASLFYQNLPLCVIDTVFSINAHYQSVVNTVHRYCAYFQITPFGSEPYPAIDQQLSVGRFLKMYKDYGIQYIAETIYGNTQRTSPRNGILKAEAIRQFCLVLYDFNIQYLQDTQRFIQNDEFAQAIKTIPGQRSGVSLSYFYILIGSRTDVKPDRMIHRFISTAIAQEVDNRTARQLIDEASKLLAHEFPNITPARLDHMIWKYQRSRDPRLKD